MPTPRRSREDLLKAVELVKKHGGNVSEAARANDISVSTLGHQWRDAKAQGLAGDVVGPVPPGQIITGTSTLYDPDGTPKVQWVKTKTEHGEQQLLEAIQDAFDRFRGFSVLPPKAKDTNADLLTLYPLPDLHLGLYAWGEESGDDFDLSIAEKTYKRATEDLIACSPGSDEAVILALGDTLHGDNAANQTPQSGHALDVDTRHSKVLQSAIWLLVGVVQLALQRHRRVTVKILPGNHDPVSAVAVSHALAMFFHNDDRVTVDLSPALHWYHRWGKCLIGAHHGHRTKLGEVAGLMACHRKEDWGATDHRYYFLGHLHHVHTKEIGGVFVEQLPSPAAKDAYHAGGGYLGGRSITAITLHRETGERFRLRHNIAP